MGNLRETFQERGFVRLNGFFNKEDVESVRADAKRVFIKQMTSRGLLTGSDPSEHEFEDGMARYFSQDSAGFINCGKTCQHLISLHRLSLRESIVSQLAALGVETPIICTRPVLYFNSRHLAKSEVYYKSPPHQDWRSMQGSLNAIVVWVPLAGCLTGARSPRNHPRQPSLGTSRIARGCVVSAHRGSSRRSIRVH